MFDIEIELLVGFPIFSSPLGMAARGFIFHTFFTPVFFVPILLPLFFVPHPNKETTTLERADF